MILSRTNRHAGSSWVAAEDKIFPALHQLGIGATLYGVMSRGLLTGSTLGDKDFRRCRARSSS